MAKLPEEQRQISFQARTQKGLFAAKIRNSCAPSPDHERADRLPKTWKKDSIKHGLGLSNIREIVERYGGQIDYQKSSSEFILFFYLSV
ncbi:MAG TPA: GHKL domain-containing protein [Candidatus Dorea gallistercoris]|uniref:GHKL domain-containing protein n=1 Tax=Candidatus Dorea gallistercoris TaxID=2838542 RepID=A0A9D1UE08_9FIRM|nr:GHKL domain-containing protein [Candidatus Dorea gallistercoris]